jgi:hypothetical protein
MRHNSQNGLRGMFRQITPRYSVVDALYFTIGMLTHFYGGALAFLFVFRASSVWPTLVGLLGAMQEPYWGGLGVYVI